jgi:hypothetical protein
MLTIASGGDGDIMATELADLLEGGEDGESSRGDHGELNAGLD